MGEDKDWTTIIQQSKEKHKGKTLNEHESKKNTPLCFEQGTQKIKHSMVEEVQHASTKK